MTRIDRTDPLTAPALELLGRVLEEADAAGLDALIEPLLWRDGAVARDTDSIVAAAVIAHDMGSPLLKVPVPDEAAGAARADAVARVVDSVGVPVLFLGGPRSAGPGDGARSAESTRQAVLDEVVDVMTGGAAGMAIGRAILQDDDPKSMAALRGRGRARRGSGRARLILTLDLGTTVTKAVLWGDGGLVASGRAALRTDYGAGGRAEQDPDTWWPSVVAACAACCADLAGAPGASGPSGAVAVDAIGFAAARQTLRAGGGRRHDAGAGVVVVRPPRRGRG